MYDIAAPLASTRYPMHVKSLHMHWIVGSGVMTGPIDVSDRFLAPEISTRTSRQRGIDICH